MYKIKVLIAVLLSVPAMAVAQKQPDLVRYANTLQGTDSNFDSATATPSRLLPCHMAYMCGLLRPT